eukprot:CAMPEP_0174261868 /NCGR_PEP_ID=MMETSP0439-20130205/12540_1 /TAXON_ID=0 /ORGANISM="Stereomyxa ramosa, Strain Chinc5" /LENGTH=353 /DNA_ID=CAMNT_0015346467 /DNA_START=86 /DNA_END=1147 /DNA_ORIENTATION=+
MASLSSYPVRRKGNDNSLLTTKSIVSHLKNMFPQFDNEVIQFVLQEAKYSIPRSVEILLDMSGQGGEVVDFTDRKPSQLTFGEVIEQSGRPKRRRRNSKRRKRAPSKCPRKTWTLCDEENMPQTNYWAPLSPEPVCQNNVVPTEDTLSELMKQSMENRREAMRQASGEKTDDFEFVENLIKLQLQPLTRETEAELLNDLDQMFQSQEEVPTEREAEESLEEVAAELEVEENFDLCQPEAETKIETEICEVEESPCADQTMELPDQSLVSVKLLAEGGSFYRFGLDKASDNSWSKLCNDYAVSCVSYVDEEGDVVSCNSQAQLDEAIRLHEEFIWPLSSGVCVLRLTALPEREG